MPPATLLQGTCLGTRWGASCRKRDSFIVLAADTEFIGRRRLPKTCQFLVVDIADSWPLRAFRVPPRALLRASRAKGNRVFCGARNSRVEGPVSFAGPEAYERKEPMCFVGPEVCGRKGPICFVGPEAYGEWNQ